MDTILPPVQMTKGTAIRWEIIAGCREAPCRMDPMFIYTSDAIGSIERPFKSLGVDSQQCRVQVPFLTTPAISMSF